MLILVQLRVVLWASGSYFDCPIVDAFECNVNGRRYWDRVFYMFGGLSISQHGHLINLRRPTCSYQGSNSGNPTNQPDALQTGPPDMVLELLTGFDWFQTNWIIRIARSASDLCPDSPHLVRWKKRHHERCYKNYLQCHGYFGCMYLKSAMAFRPPTRLRSRSLTDVLVV